MRSPHSFVYIHICLLMGFLCSFPQLFQTIPCCGKTKMAIWNIQAHVSLLGFLSFLMIPSIKSFPFVFISQLDLLGMTRMWPVSLGIISLFSLSVSQKVVHRQCERLTGINFPRGRYVYCISVGRIG